MTGQQTLDGGPAHNAGLSRRVLAADGHIDHAAWLRTRAEGGFVGTCRACGDYLIPDAPVEIAGRTDYAAHCRRVEECRYELAAPGGRVMRGSNRKSGQPRGA